MDSGADHLESGERARFTIATRRLIYLFQNVHYQHRKGVVDEELWDAWLVSLDEFLTYKGFRDVLDEVRPHLSKPFRALVADRSSRNTRQ